MMIQIRPDCAINPAQIVKMYKIVCRKDGENPNEKINKPGLSIYYLHKGTWENEFFFASEEERDRVFHQILTA